MASKPHYSKEPYYVTVGGGSTGGGGGGMRFNVGTGEPDASIGQPGDVYLDKGNGDFYTNGNGAWTLEFNIKGERGATGAAGTDGVAGPKGDPGANGATGATGAAGTAGATGETGPKGDPGAAGSTGPAGFGTEAQYDDIIARLTALETPEV